MLNQLLKTSWLVIFIAIAATYFTSGTLETALTYGGFFFCLTSTVIALFIAAEWFFEADINGKN